MAHQGEMPKSATIDRSDRHGHIGLVLLLAAVLVGAILGLRFLEPDQAQLLILGLLAFFAMAGVFFLFAAAIGVIRFSGRTVRNDITKVIADTAAEGVIAVEDDGRVVYANETYLAMAGASVAGDVRPVERLFTGAAEVSEAIYRLAQAAREHRSGAEEIRLSPSLGGAQEFGWYRVRVRPLPRPGGREASLWSIADVTHERERQENVFQELQHAIDYLDHAPAGFLSIDPNGRIVYLNATLASWLDYDLAQVGSGGLSLSDIVPRNVVAMMTSFSGDPGSVRTETFDLDLRRRNGQFLPVRLYHRIAFGQNGRMGASRTLVLNRSPGLDVDEGQRAAEVRFARFFNNTPIAIATVNRAGRIVQANAPFTRLFGTLPRTGENGEGPSIIEAFRAGEGAQVEAALKAAAEDRSDIQPLELHTAGSNGSSVRVWVTSVGLTGTDGEIAVLYALDTTDFRKVEEQLAQSQKMNAVGQLAGGVAHDFNNVLQAIIGYSDLLLGSHRPTDPSFQDIMQIKQNANRAASLVRQLLAFSRRQTLRPEVLNLNDRLYDLSMLLKRLLGERVELDLNHGRDLWFVKADLNQFEQVVMNLAVNARDAMPDGGKLSIRTANVSEAEAARLHVSGMPPAEYVMVEVADTGTGMASDILEKIFEPFFTTKEVGKGTGLGLSTVFGIVKQSNGFIDVDSQVGGGTIFRIYLPRHIPEVQEQPEAAKEDTAKKPAADMTGQGTILLVEDEDPVRAVNARALSARGYTVLEAASGIEALQVMEERGEPVDLVVSDVVMPEMDGPTLLGELRRLYPDLKVIFVSGYAEDAFRKNLPEGEEFNFLPKPFSLRQLVETVKQVMGR
ncbi:cell cycle histidine kinase CckA [Microvirga sp. 17 mud 1-3]|uniref:cell cycle histidine kinase CckA n=1 Tax=Microvirga sp. 17 mud 1-3 TaxID=2082949 RepID=UPI000D6BF3E9|nr:response regulator [Microvirga sp. 17 mud 1-3]AWM87627.1 hybrid sensor histidine kinase/response regulator [Microvirga sp. 17 mud 1-3]